MSHSNATLEVSASSTSIPRAHLLKFLIPSLIGVLLFLIPFQFGETVNIGMGLMADGLQTLLGGVLPAIALGVLCVSVMVTLYVKLAKPAWAQQGHFKEMFDVGPVWIAMRVLGADSTQRVYLVRSRGAPETSNRTSSVQFSLTPPPGAGPRDGLFLSMRRVGDNLSVAFARNYCLDRKNLEF